MKHFASVFSLFARCSIYKVLLILGTMVGAEAAWLLYSARYETYAELAFQTAGLHWFFGAAGLVMTLLLMITASGEGTRYTLDRLQMSTAGVFLCNSLYNTLVFLLLWLVQTTAAAVLCGYFLANSQGIVQSQDFMLAFYRQKFLHSLLPMEETIIWWRNGLLCLALGMSTAHFSLRRRMGKMSPAVLMAWAAAVLFQTQVGLTGGEMMSLLLCVWAIGYVVYQLWWNGEVRV